MRVRLLKPFKAILSTKNEFQTGLIPLTDSKTTETEEN